MVKLSVFLETHYDQEKKIYEEKFLDIKKKFIELIDFDETYIGNIIYIKKTIEDKDYFVPLTYLRKNTLVVGLITYSFKCTDLNLDIETRKSSLEQLILNNKVFKIQSVKLSEFLPLQFEREKIFYEKLTFNNIEKCLYLIKITDINKNDTIFIIKNIDDKKYFIPFKVLDIGKIYNFYSKSLEMYISTRQTSLEDKIKEEQVFKMYPDFKVFLDKKDTQSEIFNYYSKKLNSIKDKLINITNFSEINQGEQIFILKKINPDDSVIHMDISNPNIYLSFIIEYKFLYCVLKSTFLLEEQIYIITQTYLENLIKENKVFKLNTSTVHVEQPKSYMFDFDCTITMRHFFHLINNKLEFLRLYSDKPEVIENVEYLLAQKNYFLGSETSLPDDTYKNKFITTIFGNQERLNALKEMFRILQTKGEIIIASRGLKDQIIKCLNFVGINSPDNILIKEENIFGGVNKVVILMDKTSKSNVFYVDDDHTEHNKFFELKHIEGLLPVGPYGIISCDIGKFTYKFMSGLVKDIGAGLDISQMKKIPRIFDEDVTKFGGSQNLYIYKYKKYKNKNKNT